jgi:hypothetical protein
MSWYYEGNKVHIQFWIDHNYDISEYDGELSKNQPNILELLGSYIQFFTLPGPSLKQVSGRGVRTHPSKKVLSTDLFRGRER